MEVMKHEAEKERQHGGRGTAVEGTGLILTPGELGQETLGDSKISMKDKLTQGQYKNPIPSSGL